MKLSEFNYGQISAFFLALGGIELNYSIMKGITFIILAVVIVIFRPTKMK